MLLPWRKRRGRRSRELLPSGQGAGGGAKDFSALGGKVSGAGAGVEAEEGEAVEGGRDGVKLLTFGDGKVDKDAVLQAGKAQIERLKAASQEIVFEVLDIVGGWVVAASSRRVWVRCRRSSTRWMSWPVACGNFGDHGSSI